MRLVADVRQLRGIPISASRMVFPRALFNFALSQRRPLKRRVPNALPVVSCPKCRFTARQAGADWPHAAKQTEVVPQYVACFTHHGDAVIVGTPRGQLISFSTTDLEVCAHAAVHGHFRKRRKLNYEMYRHGD
jgi:hypothetical protein